MPPAVYSIKLDPVHLEGARKFFARVKLPLQDALRAQIKMASDCERCMALVEDQAPVEQVQGAFAGILANAKETWHLNGMFRNVILKIAKACDLPENFITNVMVEAERSNVAPTGSLEQAK